jgi:membrane associated rhomboid family serine protease
MLSERPFLQGGYRRERTSVLTWLISALVAGFVVQAILGSGWFGGGTRMENHLGVSVAALADGRIWTLLTHPFVHSPTFVVHAFVNVLALFLIGRELLPLLGGTRLVGLFASASVVGALAWSGVHWTDEAPALLVGSSAGVLALLTVFACFFPYRQLTFLLFFLFPVTLRPKYVALFLFGFSLLSLAMFEIPAVPLPFEATIASSAHLGGMIAGLVYYRFFHDPPWSAAMSDRAGNELPRWLTRRRPNTPLAPPAIETAPDPAPPGPRGNIRAEIDRILDKINSEGLGALTPEEKRLLDNARDLLSRP